MTNLISINFACTYIFWKVLFILSFTPEKMTNLQLIPPFVHFFFVKTSPFTRWVKIATLCIAFLKSSSQCRKDGTFTQVNQHLRFLYIFLTFSDCSCLIRPLFSITENKISLLSECSCICECWFCGQVGQEHYGFEKC